MAVLVAVPLLDADAARRGDGPGFDGELLLAAILRRRQIVERHRRQLGFRVAEHLFDRGIGPDDAAVERSHQDADRRSLKDRAKQRFAASQRRLHVAPRGKIAYDGHQEDAVIEGEATDAHLDGCERAVGTPMVRFRHDLAGCRCGREPLLERRAIGGRHEIVEHASTQEPAGITVELVGAPVRMGDAAVG
jgi:hypothetical protein